MWNNLFWGIEIVLTMWNIYTKSSATCMASGEVFICEHLMSWFNYVEYNTFINFNEGKSSEFPLQSVLLSCLWLYMNIVYFGIVSAVISASEKITQHSMYLLSFFFPPHWSRARCSCTSCYRVGPVMTFMYMYQPPVAPTHKISSALCYAWLIIYERDINSEFVLIAFWVQCDNFRCSHWKT